MKKDFQRKILKNGMTVVFEKRDLPVVSVAYAVRYGGINEELKDKGIAHFIEHMLYKGTKELNTQKIAEAFERKGGIMNGFTGEQVTAFWVKAPSKPFFEIFEVLTEMVKNPAFDLREIEKERKVIFEEIKMRNDNPRIFILDKIKAQLYEDPFGPDLIGTPETLDSIDREKLVENFKKIYQPQNMICVVVGDVDFDKICNFLEKNFERGDFNPETVSIKPKIENKIFKRKGIDQANLILAFHGPKASEKGNYVANVLMTLMGGGLSSRLFLEIRSKRNLVYNVKADSDANKDFGYNCVYAGTTKENVDKVKNLILEEFKKVSEELSEKELESVKEQVVGNFYVSQEDSQAALVELLAAELAGNSEEILKFEENIRKVKLEDVKKMASEITEDKCSFLALVPEE